MNFIEKKYSNLILNKLDKSNISKFAVILGLSPSKGARSPILWNSVYKKMNKNISMLPFDVKKENIKKIFQLLKADPNFIGGSVTMPYKTKMTEFVDVIDPIAKIIGSINTIQNKCGKKFIGFNTDYNGCCATLKRIKLKKKDKILIIGIGGAGKACVLSALNIYKNNLIYLFNRDYSKVKKFKFKLKSKKIMLIKNYKALNNVRNIKLVINASSVGFDNWFENKQGYLNLKYFSPLSDLKKMKCIKSKNEKKFVKKNLLLIKDNIIKTYKFFQNNEKSTVFDIIYNPQRTVLQNICLLFNKNIFNGLNMNLEQAVLGFCKVNNIRDLNKVRKLMF